jgi:aldose 1-epimerase
MNISRQFCFTHSSGEDIYLFTLRNAKGTEVLVTNFGAIITAFRVRNNDGTTSDIVLGFDKVEDYLSAGYLEQYPWFGCAVGRYANRIKDSTFELDGKEYHLIPNQGSDQLHGGQHGFDKQIWKYSLSGDTPFTFLELTYKSPDGEEGFPGNLEVRLRFELNDDNELSYEYRATTDAPTPVNLTHHSYFNLDRGKGTIAEHEIKILASKMLEQDERLLVTGKIEDVTDTGFDFRNFTKIAEGLKKVVEYDKSLITENGIHAEPTLVAEARSLKSNMQLQVFSTEPVVHFYAGKWIPRVKGKNGNQYGPFSGFCLETHKHPNAVNIPEFPNTILRPGEQYYQKTIYKLFNPA